jgi:murein DD-endopeptidase MepM/ murein hydrolase activator NlpD
MRFSVFREETSLIDKVFGGAKQVTTTSPAKLDTPSKPTTNTDISKPYIGYKTGKIAKPVSASAGSPFGPRHGRPHNGTDFPVPVGTPIKAPEDGVVKKVGSDNMNGNHVVISSGKNEHWLLHLSKINVSNGQTVKQGDVVGLSGNTGRSTGPHLHWELHVAGTPVNPMSNIG